VLWSCDELNLEQIKPKWGEAMYSKINIQETERTFKLNARIDDRFDPIRADRELNALRRKLHLQKRTAKAARNIANMMTAWMHNSRNKNVAKV
jgi:hypothetical protein